MMRDPVNPYRSEIREWAFTKDALEPMQDWDLMLAHTPEFDLYVELTADDTCPAWSYFLQALYLIVGDAVSTGYRSQPRDVIKALLTETRKYSRPHLHLFRQRSEKLMKHPETFEYNDWCTGGIVTKDLESID